MYFDDGVMATVFESTGCNSSVKWLMYSQISIRTNLFKIDRISAMISLTFIYRYSQEITDNFYIIFFVLLLSMMYVREAAKKVIILVVRPPRGRGG